MKGFTYKIYPKSERVEDPPKSHLEILPVNSVMLKQANASVKIILLLHSSSIVVFKCSIIPTGEDLS